MLELIMVIALIAVLASSLFAILNPIAQVNKAKDSQKRSVLQQLKNALETYYHDNGYYPDASTLVFNGGEFKDTSTTPVTLYMKTLPTFVANEGPFYYVSGTSPQSYVITWKKVGPTIGTNAVADCPLSVDSTCSAPPHNQLNGSNYICIYAGAVNCSSPNIP